MIVIALVTTHLVRAADPLPPELADLDAQFLALQSERVTAPFDAEVKKLNDAYLARITKMHNELKAAGDLDGTLAFAAEQFDFASKETVPEIDEGKTPPSLKAVRTIYREARAKLVATRQENLQKLVAPLAIRLQQMESDFTKVNRVAEALVVRGYREALGETKPFTPAGENTPAKMAVVPAVTLALKDGVENSLGMKFVPVKGTEVLFCIHEVRYKDYAAYAADSQGVDAGYKDQSGDGYTPNDRTEDHPVVRVSWDDAQKFCAWLSKKEGKLYRLPTDQEWSIAVGIGQEEKWKSDTTPATVFKDQSLFPWGKEWPPPKGAGNYSDVSRHAKAPGENRAWLEGYDDNFPTTAPVMSFEPNAFGLYDMGGNLWEWVEDFYDNANKDRVLRGTSWGDIERGGVLSSYRYRTTPESRSRFYGFRVVVVPSTTGQ